MAKRYSDLGEELQEVIISEVDAHSSLIHSKKREELTPVFKKQYGMCISCSYFAYASTDFRVIVSYCKRLKIYRKEGDVVSKCSEYDEVGRMNIYDMERIAYVLELDKGNIGF
ncbi:hypothetical protein AUJ83_03425 [Candidatus Woesearchaeota archaeon CG1_02_33_12]|nr:MAG: hypothetical protein AUJ83_03425 [Candidatus Woesearchaeota archaeon CG1_02_33_12]